MNNEKDKLMLISVFFAILILFTFNTQAQTPGYYYTYDASGNRLERTYTTVFLKQGDTTMFQSVVENYTVKIFPNPVKDYLQVDIQGLSKENSVRIQLLDLQGTILFHWENIKNSFQVETKQLVAGSYYLNIYIDDKRSFWKIIKEY